MSRTPLLVACLSLSFALPLAAPRIAHAGCYLECDTIRNIGVTVTPPLDCLVTDGAPDDYSCTCSSTQRFVNNCVGAVELAAEAPKTDCAFGCGPKTIASGEKLKVDVYVPADARLSGAPYTERASARYVLTRTDDPQQTRHIIEIAAEAGINPEASACSASPRGLRGSHHAAAFGALGAALIAGIRRARRRR